MESYNRFGVSFQFVMFFQNFSKNCPCVLAFQLNDELQPTCYDIIMDKKRELVSRFNHVFTFLSYQSIAEQFSIYYCLGELIRS